MIKGIIILTFIFVSVINLPPYTEQPDNTHPQKTSTTKQLSSKQTISQAPANYGNYDFTFTGIYGGIYKLSQYSGKIVLVNIWAPWCEPCNKETEGFVRLYDIYKSEGFEILGIAVQTTPSEVRSFIYSHNVKYAVGIKDDITKLYKSIGIPASYLFSPDGNLIKEFIGYTDEKALQLLLDSTLKNLTKKKK